MKQQCENKARRLVQKRVLCYYKSQNRQKEALFLNRKQKKEMCGSQDNNTGKAEVFLEWFIEEGVDIFNHCVVKRQRHRGKAQPTTEWQISNTLLPDHLPQATMCAIKQRSRAWEQVACEQQNVSASVCLSEWCGVLCNVFEKSEMRLHVFACA